MRSLFLIALIGLAVAACPEASRANSISTIFAGDNQNSAGGANFFNLNALTGLTVTSLSVNVYNATVGAPISLEVWARAGTALGFETTSAGWTKVSSGSGVNVGQNGQSVVDVTDFTLPAGLTGLAIHNVNYQSEYTNGTGANQVYSNANLTLTMGTATNLFLVPGVVNTPRVWNGTIVYNTVSVPDSGSSAHLVLGCLLPLAFWKRRLAAAS